MSPDFKQIENIFPNGIPLVNKKDYSHKEEIKEDEIKVEKLKDNKPLLNQEQIEAINITSGNILIIASAGTGKTTTIVERYANMVNNLGYKPEEIMMTTFTNKASKDMIKKIFDKTGFIPPFVGTMHSLFLRIIRDNSDKLFENKEFTLLHDDSDKKKIIRIILENEKMDFKADSVNYFFRWISKFKNLGVLAENLNENFSLDDNINKGVIEEVIDDEIVRVNPLLRKYVNKIYKKYEAELKKYGFIDIDDILLLTFKLFNKYPKVKEFYVNKFKAIMVDESQDLNVVQKNILNLLKNNNLCLIGDDCQNIYEWRGSSNQLVFDFSENEKTIFLKDNYRSDKIIIEKVNQVIESMKFKIPKKLNCTKNKLGNFEIEGFFSSKEEIDFVVKKIKSLLNKGVSKDQIAVLFRTNRIGKEIERELTKNKIPSHLSKSKDFFEREEIKDIISFLRLKINPYSLIDFERIFLLQDGFGKVALKRIIDFASKENCSFLEVLDKLEKINLSEANISQMNLLKSVLYNFEKNPLSLFLEDFNYENILSRKYHEDILRLEDKFENINVLIGLFKEYNSTKEDICKFLDELIDLEKKEKTKDKITLTTIHSAKGLEWEHVFLISCNERILPFYIKDLETLKRDSELRLFYVAISRAKNSLIITYYEKGNWGKNTEKSSFLNLLDI